MDEIGNQNNLSDYRKRLKSFAHQSAGPDPELRLRQIQEDLVILAGWGSSPETKQIGSELRRMYAEALSPGGFTDDKQHGGNGQNFQERQTSGIPSIKVGRISPVKVIFGLGLWVFISIVGMGIGVSLSDPIKNLGIGLVWAAGNIIGLFTFFKIVAPGVNIFLLVPPNNPHKPLTGILLGILGGLGWAFFLILIAMGLISYLPNATGIVFLSSILLIPVLGITIGKSIAHQSLNKPQREQR